MPFGHLPSRFVNTLATSEANDRSLDDFALRQRHGQKVLLKDIERIRY